MTNKAGKRRSITLGIKLVVTLLILWFLAHHSQLNFELFTSVFSKPWYALAIIGILSVSVISNSLRWHRLNSVQGINLPFSRSVIATYISIAFNNVLPGSVGGDVVRCYYVMKHFPEQKSGAILSTFLDRVSGLLGIIVITSVIALYRFDIFIANRSLFYIISFCFGITLTAIMLFCLSLLLPRRISISHILKQKFGHHRLFQPIASLLEAVSIYRNAKLVILESLMFSIITQLILLAVISLIINMMGLPDIPAYTDMMALAIGQIANLIPLTPGGIGMGEAAFSNVILIFNPDVIGAYATVFFAFRLFITLIYLPGIVWGIFGFNLLNKNVDEHLITESV